MLRKIFVAVLVYVMAFPVVGATAASGDTVIRLQDSNGAGIAGVELNASAPGVGTYLRIKTDSSGKATFPALRGTGGFSINHCTQSASSIALEIYDVDYGNGGQSFTITLPPRPEVFEYQLKTSAGLTITQPQEIEGYFTPPIDSYMEDYGEFEFELGSGSISSCGSAWFKTDTLRVSPFSTSTEAPSVAIPIEISGGTTTLRYPVRDFSSAQKPVITVEGVKHIAMTSVGKVVYERQPTRIVGQISGIESISELPSNSVFEVRCLSTSRLLLSAGSIRSSKPRQDLSVSSLVTFQGSGRYKCILSSSSRQNLVSSWSFQVNVKPRRDFVSATKRKYRSCAALNLNFEGGLAKTRTTQRADSSSRFLAAVSAQGYRLNSALDRDRDGVVCER
jgi:hypothetical protein